MKLPFELNNPQNWPHLSQEFTELCQVIAALRDAKKGCPWDLKQDFKSLQKYLIEEAYEAIAAVNQGDTQEFCEELGDVMLQVLLNSQIAYDEKKFSMLDVMRGLKEKLIRRHPHVFLSGAALQNASEVEAQWTKIKKSEKKQTNNEPIEDDLKKLAQIYPATLKGAAIGNFSSKVSFDWSEPEEVFAKLESEIAELRAELQAETKDRHKIADELSDVYFTLAQLCRHLKENPEQIAEQGNSKFLKRFKKMLKKAAEKQRTLSEMSKSDLESLWIEAKSENP